MQRHKNSTKSEIQNAVNKSNTPYIIQDTDMQRIYNSESFHTNKPLM